METFKAQFISAGGNAYFLNLLDISDTVNTSIVRHEFMNIDGAVLQNLGNRARETKFRTYWFGFEPNNGDVMSPNYQNHFYFLEEILDSQHATHTLIHPKYGAIEGMVETPTIVHDDTQEYVTIDLTFIQSGIQNESFLTVDNLSVIDSMEVAQVNAALAKSASSINGSGFGAVLGKVVDPLQKLALQFNNVSQATRQFLNDCDRNINIFETALDNVTAPLTTIDAAINYASDVPSRIIGSINGACSRVTASLANLSNLPGQFTNNMILNMTGIYNMVTGSNADFFRTQFMSVSAGALLNQSGTLLKADEERRTAQIAKEQKQSFDVAGNLINPITFQPIMSIQDLDNMMFNVRTYAQSALLLDRESKNLKEMAAALISYVDDLKLRRLSIKNVQVNNIPLHLLMLQFGFPYNMAERVLALNPQVHNPTFCEGTLKVYATTG